MAASIHNGTDWNQHHGIGATLLENWVEERAVGAEVIQSERADMGKLNKNGHADILIHKEGENTYQTSQKDAYNYISKYDRHQHHLGKRRAMIEAKLLERAREEVKEPPVDRSAAGWMSTARSDYGHVDIYGRIPDLDEIPLSKAEVDHFRHPITFWSDHAKTGQGTVMCSTVASELVERQERNCLERFGRHASFTTPIEEYKVAPTKTE
ncbi:hypothetical protein BJ742DRAFT_105547 [Cladochytrium replicatum]|nr:hypothetical protein BJ742DRAFT_105547 [Cladochytrium replicatum]